MSLALFLLVNGNSILKNFMSFCLFQTQKRSFWWEKYESLRNPENAWRWDIWVRISRQAHGRRGPRRHQKVLWLITYESLISKLTFNFYIKLQVFETIFIVFFHDEEKVLFLGRGGQPTRSQKSEENESCQYRQAERGRSGTRQFIFRIWVYERKFISIYEKSG